MAKEQYSLKLIATNIGPLEKLNFNTTFESSSPNIKIAIYAKNGSGKTMLSKTFNLTNKNKEELTWYNTAKLISKGENNASFVFNLAPSIDKNKLLSINMVRNSPTTINNKSGYIFHVFNTEYIQENILPRHYEPNDKIDGYILGKENIDLSEDEQHLSQIEADIQIVLKEIEKRYKESIGILDKLKIDKKTKEYRDYTFDSLMIDDVTNVESFEELSQKHDKLCSFPDDITDISMLNYRLNEELFNIDEFLLKPYLKSQMVEDVRNYISENFSFISKGLELLENDKTKCPFCRGKIDKDAKETIDIYLKYIVNEEAKVIAKINDYISNINHEKEKIISLEKEFNVARREFDKVRKYLPSFSEIELNDISLVDISNILDNIIESLKEKIKDVTKSINIFDGQELSKEYKKITELIANNNKLIEEINKRKSKIRDEKLELNRQICVSMKIKVQHEIKDEIKKIIDLKEIKRVLEGQINEKRSKIRVSKKELVASNLEKYLSYFFGSKYCFNKENFSIVFNNQSINKELEDVLSDGEKSIVAFCFYLASVHMLVNNENEYEKILYIIDDPISSMDFSYVFCVSRLIDNFCRTTPSQRNPILVFTHNLEFMNILIKNNLVHHKYILSNGVITELSKELISPYEHHLIDIKNIADGKFPPSHTTANSIRYILESIWKFIKPNLLNLEDFILQEEIFKNNEYIYTIINDFSHGTIRMENSYSEDQITGACKCVIDYIDKHFPGQTKMISKLK